MIEARRARVLATLIGRFGSQGRLPVRLVFLHDQVVSPYLGEAVHRDLSKDYAYLPHRDTAMLNRWINDPYCTETFADRNGADQP